MDDKNDYRGWDLWVEGGKPATHIVHKWPDNALKVVANDAAQSTAQWNHVFVTYDGSSKAAGVQIYVNGELQQTTVKADDARRDTIRTDVPFKIGQRADTARIDNVQIQDVRIYARRSDRQRSRRLWRLAPRWLIWRPRPADKRTPAENERAVRLVAAGAIESYQRTDRSVSAGWKQEKAESSSRARSLCDAGEAGSADGVHALPRRIRQAPRPGDAADAGRAAADARRSAAQSARLRASGCCGPSIR